jgi:two-component system, NtrC family, response regulator HupR/HoxA
MPRVHAVPVVLIVDDEKPNVSTFARVFRREYHVRTASSAEDALRALEAQPIDVVITDYTMPRMTGVELLEIAAQRWPDVGRVIMSGHSDLPELRVAEETGVVGALLTKPWDRETVLTVVARVLAHGGGVGTDAPGSTP